VAAGVADRAPAHQVRVGRRCQCNGARHTASPLGLNVLKALHITRPHNSTPDSWLDYYLAVESLGPTVGVPVTYAAPASAFAAWSLQPAELQPPQQQQHHEGPAQAPPPLVSSASEGSW
jgi:hypothetical protein